jgi:hypothetical protein
MRRPLSKATRRKIHAQGKDVEFKEIQQLDKRIKNEVPPKGVCCRSSLLNHFYSSF